MAAQRRVTAVLKEEDYQRLVFWAEQHEMSVNEYVRYALDLAIRRENKDYDMPTLEAARLNQMLDTVQVLSLNVSNLERVVTAGFDSLLRMTRGDNYLVSDEVDETGGDD